MAAARTTAHNPKTTSTSPKKCRISAATLGLGTRADARASASCWCWMRCDHAVNLAAANVWMMARKKMAVATATNGS